MLGTVEVAGPADVAATGIEAATSSDAIRRLDVEVAFMLFGLANGHALTNGQARRLWVHWRELDEDTWSQPWLRGVPEHTRSYIGCFGRTGSLV